MRARKPNKRKPDRSEELWSGGELATLFGCDRTLVVKLHGKVFQPIDQPGQRIRTLYRLGESVRAWGAYQVNLVRNDSPTARAMETERLRKLNLDCEIKAIDLSILKGQVHLGDDVKQVIAERNMRFRSGVQALPTKLARILVGQREMSTVFRLISAECEELLRNLAEYKASDYLVKNPEVLARLLKEEKDASRTNGAATAND